jgi:hypothetical protein
MRFRVRESLVNIAHFPEILTNQEPRPGTFIG